MNDGRRRSKAPLSSLSSIQSGCRAEEGTGDEDAEAGRRARGGSREELADHGETPDPIECSSRYNLEAHAHSEVGSQAYAEDKSQK